MPILAGLRIIPVRPTSNTPGWVVVSIGLAFLFAGIILFSDAAAGGTGPDGQLLDTAPAWVKPFQSVMALAIAATLASIASWIAFGSGERHFSMSISLPFIAARKLGGDTMGRWAFGIGAVLILCVIAGVLVSVARKALAKNAADRNA